MAEGMVSTVAAPVVENSVNAIGRQFGYLWNYKKNMANLEKQVKILENKISDTSRSVTAAERNAEEIGDEVQGWLSEAKDISAGARDLLEEHAKKGKNRCLIGLCPNLVSRHQFSRSACKKQMDVLEGVSKEGHIRKVSFHPVGQGSTVLLTEGCFTFDSRKSIKEDIMKALQDETKRLVGVYGIGGMGKTTLAKQVASQAKEEKLFEEVVFASVTQNADMKEIQGQLASMLDLKLDESTVAERANHVHQRLKGKKVLVILDDLWKELDLNEVGISLGVENMRCKILLTSRYKQVLSSMGTEEFFNVDALGEEEAWKLFEKKNNIVHTRSDINKIGKEIAQRCRGWPVLIVTISASLSRQSELSIWKDALNQLKKMNNKKMHDIVNYAIETISYNQLEKTHKRLFLLCGVIGGVASIEELLQYSWGWDLFDGEAATIQEARDRLHKLILDLKESCLLMDDVDSVDFIIMHDVVRDVAISIGKKDLNMISMGAESNTWPKDDDLRKCTALVLRGCPNLPCLPPLLECPSLELFVLSDTSLSIPETFFEMTSKLKVLGMSGLRFTSLPKCLSFSTNLQTLLVNNCYSLKDVSVVGELKKLQTLSFADSSIEELPSGIGNLSELRLLDMRRCSQLKVIPAGLIEGLSRLEEFYVDRQFYMWEADVCVNGSVNTNGSLRELEQLPNLCSLEISVGDDKLLPKNINFEKLERYEITVGDSWNEFDRQWLNELQVTRTLCFMLSTTSINQLQHGVKRLFKTAECLWLTELKGIKNVVPALDEDGLPVLKHLRIEKDYEIQYVLNVEDKGAKAMFTSLESLHLIELMKLRKLCNGPLMEQSFCSLTTLTVKKCIGLKSLLSFSMATKLPKLQEIRVSRCNVLEEIVAENNINDDRVCEKIEFAEMRKLFLCDLPKLKKFFNSGDDTDCQEIHAEEEEELISSLPFFRKVSFPKLQELILYEISNFTEIWSHRTSYSCCNLTKVEIHGCDNLKYLLTASVAMTLVGLQNLTVKNCARMKHIVAMEEGDTNTVVITFPQLSSLRLFSLNHLTTFYSSTNLDSATQPLFNEKISFPKLGELELFKIYNLRDIWNHELQGMPCRNITRLTIHQCNSLKHVFPDSLVPSFNKLEYLNVQDCEVLKTVIGDEKSIEETATFSFPKLTDVHLQSLPKAECFYPKEHTIQCLELNVLKVADCGKLYTIDFLGFPEKQGDAVFEKALSNLKTMSIRNNELMKIMGLYDHNLPPHLFRSLEDVYIMEFQGGSVVFPSNFLNIIHNQLRSLKVIDCSFQEIFPFEGHDIHDDILLPQLSMLTLQQMPELKYTCKQEQYPPRLTSLVSSSVSFRSLTWLTVNDCGGLTNLIQPSTAKSLGELISLEISGCEMMEKIIGDDEVSSQDGDEFIFTNLEQLILEKLPRLTNFCSSPYHTFNFPDLWNVNVGECPNMKTFCGGITTTTRLDHINYNDENCWEGDLNTTILQSFAKREANALSSTSSSNHDEPNAFYPEYSSEELSDSMTEVESCPTPENESQVYKNSTESRKGTETYEKVVEEGKEGDVCVKATAPGVRHNGKGKEGDVCVKPKLCNVEYKDNGRWEGDLNTTIQQSFAKREANAFSSEKLIDSMTKVESCPKPKKDSEVSKYSTESRKRTETYEKVVEEGKEGDICVNATAPDIFEKGKGKEVEASTSSNNQFDQHAEKAVEPTKQQLINHVVDELGNNNTYCDNAIEPRKANTEDSAKARVCESDAANAEKTADIFGEGCIDSRHGVASSSCLSPPLTDPPAQTTLSLAAELDVERSNCAVPTTSSCSEQKLCETQNHSVHFIPLLSEFLQIIQNQPLKSMSKEHVQFMENAYRDLSDMNFSINWFNPYVDKAREYLTVLEQRREVSEIESEIAKMEAQMEAMKQKKRALQQKYDGIASQLNLDKSLLDN